MRFPWTSEDCFKTMMVAVCVGLLAWFVSPWIEPEPEQPQTIPRMAERSFPTRAPKENTPPKTVGPMDDGWVYAQTIADLTITSVPGVAVRLGPTRRAVWLLGDEIWITTGTAEPKPGARLLYRLADKEDAP